MAKQTRVHILAKELGVKSKAIIDKCQAEGLDIKNHMSTISIGLAATIREWFSEGEHGTTVETTKRVDLKKVRIKEKKTVKKKTAKKKTAKSKKPSGVIEEVEPESAAVSGPVFVKPPKPESVIPAGPILEKPKPAKLAGPRVIRVEATEEADIRRAARKPRVPRVPRTPRAPRPDRNAVMTEPLMPAAPDVSGGKGRKADKRKKKHRDEAEVDAVKKPKAARSRMRARDFEDRRARLAAAMGETLRTRPSRRIESKKFGRRFGVHIERPEKATVAEPITVKDLSAAIAVKTGDIIAKLMEQGTMVTANHAIDSEMAEFISLEFGTELTVEKQQLLQEQLEEEFRERERNNLEARPPVVTMLGHVDHGKTSLLDRIRSTSVTDGEAGGITQHIGASQVEWKGKKITFLDTPGHEAFTAMRARGANMTDIVVLVIAADDGVMPQTAEAINHAKAAGVEMIIALNKIDLPGVDLNRIYGQLAEHELTPTEWGGNTEIVKTSATTGLGIEDLLEHLDYIADLKEYQADPTIPAMGWIVEAKMTATQGAVATILLKEGELKKSDIVLAGNSFGRVRTMKNSHGKSIKSTTSSTSVEISGLNEVPQAGDKFFVLQDINRAKSISEQNKAREREETLTKKSAVTLENLFSQIEAGNVKELNLIVKADVQGSVDVLNKYLTDLSTEKVKIVIIHSAVGGVTEGDVLLAEASGAIVIGFNVVPDDKVKELADLHNVNIRLYNIIYRITEDLKDAMLGLLEPEFEEKQVGSVIVRDTFKHSRVGTIAGCYVNSGLVTKNSKVRLIRDSVVMRDNCSIESLKHFKDDVKEVKAGLECGIKIARFDDIKIGDIFEVYEIVELQKTL